MGVDTFKRPTVFKGGARIPTTAVQTVTSTAVSTAAALTAIRANAEVALITTSGSGAGYEVKLSTGRSIGTSVTVAVATDSTAPVTLLLESTTQSIFGSTFNALTFSTNSSGETATLTKVSATQYIGSFDAAKVTPGGSTGTV